MQRGDTLRVIERLMMFTLTFLTLGRPQFATFMLHNILEIISMAQIYDALMKTLSRSYFIRPDLLFPREAPYFKVLEQRNDRAFIQLVRVPTNVFDYIYDSMDAGWKAAHDGWTDERRLHRRPGRPHMLDSKAVLALTLAWLGSTTKVALLELVFGAGHSVLDRDLASGLSQLLSTLRRMAETECKMPTQAEKDEYAAVIEGTHGPNPYPSSRVWGFIDGLRLMMKTPEDFEQESFFYNGWLKMVNVCCVFLFTPDGKIACATINVSLRARLAPPAHRHAHLQPTVSHTLKPQSPGSMHDFTVSRTILASLIDLNSNPLNYAVAGDSAFSSAATDAVIATAEAFIPPPADLPRDSDGAVNVQAAARQREAFRGWHRRVRQSVEQCVPYR